MRPPSERQITANHTNSQSSTGPKTAEGKSASSQNGFVHGLAGSGHSNSFRLILGESIEAWLLHTSAQKAIHTPVDALEEMLVERMTQHEWLRLRALRLQNECFHPTSGHVSATTLFELYRRYEQQHEREYNKTLTILLKLRTEREKTVIGFAREKRASELHPIQKELKEITLDRRKSHAVRQNSTREVEQVAKTPERSLAQAA